MFSCEDLNKKCLDNQINYVAHEQPFAWAVNPFDFCESFFKNYQGGCSHILTIWDIV
jgi:hypothetical protein